MKTIYYVRHGESKANVDDITAGAEIDTPLTKKGIKQAEKAGEQLKNKGIELIVCSPLSRTKDTANIIAAAIGYDKSKIIENKLFIERYVGDYSHKPFSEYLKDVHNNSLNKSVEATRQWQNRIKKGLNWLKLQNARTILVVSHGGTSRILRTILNDLHHSEAYSIEAINNAEILKFTLK